MKSRRTSFLDLAFCETNEDASTFGNVSVRLSYSAALRLKKFFKYALLTTDQLKVLQEKERDPTFGNIHQASPKQTSCLEKMKVLF